MFRRILESLFGPKEPRAHSLEEEVHTLQLQTQKKLLEDWLDGWAGPIVTPEPPLFDDPAFYQPIGYGEAIAWNYDNRLRGEAVPVYITEYGLKVMRDA